MRTIQVYQSFHLSTSNKLKLKFYTQNTNRYYLFNLYILILCICVVQDYGRNIKTTINKINSFIETMKQINKYKIINSRNFFYRFNGITIITNNSLILNFYILRRSRSYTELKSVKLVIQNIANVNFLSFHKYYYLVCCIVFLNKMSKLKNVISKYR